MIIDAPDPTENVFSDEFNGDVSTIGAQGTVTYTYASQLPYSNIPANCSFRIVGDATGASILTTGYFSDTNSAGQTVAPESQVIAGLQAAINDGANVVSESYGYRRPARRQRRPARPDQRRHGRGRRDRGRELG